MFSCNLQYYIKKIYDDKQRPIQYNIILLQLLERPRVTLRFTISMTLQHTDKRAAHTRKQTLENVIQRATVLLL